jgi:hypothetical protein
MPPIGGHGGKRYRKPWPIVQRVSGEAVDTLRTIMNDDQKPSSARVTAARMILELSIKAVELEDLEVRIATLEALSATKGGAW